MVNQRFSISRGDVCYVDFGPAAGSTPAKRRPVVVVQNDLLNKSDLATVLVVPLTSNTDRAGFSFNTFIPARLSNLPKDSVALGFSVSVINKADLEYPEAQLPASIVDRIVSGVTAAMG